MAVTPELDVVLPVYQEGRTIAATLRAIDAVVSSLTRYRFLIACDPGGDDTLSILQELQTELPITIAASPHRRGYSRAMRDALGESRAPVVVCIDSDGQYDPADIERLWRARDGADVVIGARIDRAEGRGRRLGSWLFGRLLRMAFPLAIQDPSSSLVLMRRRAIEQVLPRIGHLPDAFWWEFAAQAARRGCSILEIPVRHRPRTAGATQIYTATNLPRVIVRQGLGLLRMMRQRD